MVNTKIDMTGWKMWEHGVERSRWIVLEQVEDYMKLSLDILQSINRFKDYE